MTTSIQEFIKEVKKELVKLKQKQILADEYAEHLEKEFEEYINKFAVPIDKAVLEKDFVANLEDPNIMAKSLAGDSPQDVFKPIKLESSDKEIVKSGKDTIKGYYEKILPYYEKYKNPVTTGVVYSIFLIIVLLINFIIYLSLEVFLPQITMVSVNNGPEFLHIGDPSRISVESINGVSQLSVTPLKGQISFYIFLISLIIFFVLLAKRNYFRNFFQSMFFTTTILGLLLAPEELNFKINNIIVNHSIQWSGWSAVDNWNSYEIPDLQSITNEYLFNLIFRNLLMIFLGGLFLFILGKIIMFVMKRDFKKIYNKISKNTIFPSFFFMVFLVYVLILPQLNYMSPQSLIPPEYDQNTSGYIFLYNSTEFNGNEIFQTFGQISINRLPSFFGMFDINDSFSLQTLNQSNKENFRYLQSYNSSKESQDFNIEGLFYYSPINFKNKLVTVNSTFPLLGFTPIMIDQQFKIEWDDSTTSPLHQIDVFSIIYSSSTNTSKFSFYFDIHTGWLMIAYLFVEDNSWSTPNVFNMLRIQRTFIVERTINSSIFQMFKTNGLIMQLLTYGTMFIVIIPSYLLYERKKKLY